MYGINKEIKGINIALHSTFLKIIRLIIIKGNKNKIFGIKNDSTDKINPELKTTRNGCFFLYKSSK